MKTFYWHDYETWGVNPAIDRPSQFAGVRTDEDLNIVGEPLVMYCKPADDILPNPEACLVTGIIPQKALKEGKTEREFIAAIHRELARPKTCSVGYNSIRFDEEVTRYSLYRNYFEPYEREWRNGNSRWDIIDMLRLCYAMRPEGLEWPLLEGKPSFKLEKLTAANGISHADAHDAFSDVEATIALAKLVKTKQAALYDYVLKNKGKDKAGSLIDIKNRKPLLHISSKFPSENGCAGLIAPLAPHPVNKNAIIVYNLSVDPSVMLDLSSEEISQRIFTARAQLPEGVERLPVKLIHLNKCPILTIPKMLDATAAKRLHINKDECEKNWQKLLSLDVADKLQEVFRNNNFEGDSDPETQLYEGFVGNADKNLMKELRKSSTEELKSRNFLFEDERLNRMLLAYKARNFPLSLNDIESAEWRESVRERLLNAGRGRLSCSALREKIELLKKDKGEDSQALEVLKALAEYNSSIEARYFGA